MKDRESWTTRIAFILATLGFSAGIGNLWRFPYLAGKYGGGIFLLFYMFVVFLVAVPLFAVEITLGKATRKDPVAAYYQSFSSNGLEVVVWTLFSVAILVLILSRGLNRGVEAANNIFLILGVIVMAVFVGWVWKIPHFGRAAGIESKRALLLWTVLVKYVAPVVMLITWLAQPGLIQTISKLFH